MKRHFDHPHRGRGHGHGHEWWGPQFGPPFGPPFGGSRGRRGRRGDVRAAALLLLEEGPKHGYQLIQDIADRSNGLWRPSPGSIYPVLQQLEDEGLIEIEKVAGRNTATLTDAGRSHVDENREDLGAPWDDVQEGIDTTDWRDMGKSLKSLILAWRQVMESGTPDQRSAAMDIMNDARRRLYGLLASE